MPFNLETILPHVEAYVVVVDRNHQITYRNRVASNDTQISDPVLLASVDGAFSRKEGFKALEMKVAVPELSGSTDELNLLVAGDYAVMGGTEYVVLTVTDISELRNEADTLASSLEKAEHEALNRSSYLANMSHEIRTPVNAITGFSRLLATTDDPAKRAKYVELIETNNSLLLQLIDDVLDIAKMDQGALKFQTKEVDLNELMRSMDSTVRLRVQPRTILNYVLGAADCCIDTDPERLSQVMLNLLTNACKFTPRGSITFGYELRDESIYFFVKDTGMGIPADKQQLLFQRFSKQNDDKPGTGLGLAICKEIIDTFHGAIGVESAGEGKGSLFWFTLPVTPKEPEASSAPSATAAPAPHRQAVKAARPTILVAEDNESNYFLLSSILEDDYNLIHAWDGREAVAMFAESRPDLILMDINMPYMDGYEATRRIRQTSATVPVIAVTAYAFSSDKTRIMENGFNSYVSKPVNADRLASEIKRCLKI